MSIMARVDATVLRRPGMESAQILRAGNAPDDHLRHDAAGCHVAALTSMSTATKVWVVEKGSATLLFGDESTTVTDAGHVVETAAGVSHGRDASAVYIRLHHGRDGLPLP
jgi:mannose-6-phosphate isomerase-like protein (cupin superfamily)